MKEIQEGCLKRISQFIKETMKNNNGVLPHRKDILGELKTLKLEQIRHKVLQAHGFKEAGDDKRYQDTIKSYS